MFAINILFSKKINKYKHFLNLNSDTTNFNLTVRFFEHGCTEIKLK